METVNVYEDAKRAEAYAKLEFPDTYYSLWKHLTKSQTKAILKRPFTMEGENQMKPNILSRDAFVVMGTVTRVTPENENKEN